MTEIKKKNWHGKIRLHPVARAILQGLYDEESPFSLLLGIQHILQRIWKNVISFWRLCIKVSIPVEYHRLVKAPEVIVGNLSYVKIPCKVYFPIPTDLNINMMPFVMGKTFEKSFLPINLKLYYDNLILKCWYSQDSEFGKIGYLTYMKVT